jgi:hypothetical protein
LKKKSATNGILDEVKALIQKGADIETKSSDGCTPLIWGDIRSVASFIN